MLWYQLLRKEMAFVCELTGKKMGARLRSVFLTQDSRLVFKGVALKIHKCYL